MSIEAKTMLLNRVESSLNDKLTVRDSRTTMGVLTNELEAFEVEHLETDTKNIHDDMLQRYVATKTVQGLSKLTLERYSYMINRLMAYAKVHTSEINLYHLRSFLEAEKERGLSDNTIRGIRDIYHTYFRWLFEEGLINANPAINLAPVQEEKKYRASYDDIEIDILKAACEKLRDKVILCFLLSTGCRISEALKLNRYDVDLNAGECKVHGKGKKERKVFLDKITTYYLREYLEQRIDNCPALFVSKRGTRLTQGGVRAMLKRLEAKSGVENVHPHRCRRTLATHLIKNGAPIQVVAAILGHEKLDTTMRYIAYTTDMIKDAYNKYY